MLMLRRYGPVVLTLWIAFVFVQSLASKFGGAKEAIYIFTTIDQWASEALGLKGVFGPGGLLGPTTIGILELLASLALLLGLALILAGRRGTGVRLHRDGALLAFAIISAALFFHLFTPLGVDVGDPSQGIPKDGGALFGMAVSVWLSAFVLLWVHHRGIWPADGGD